jgi:hypothetical protein
MSICLQFIEATRTQLTGSPRGLDGQSRATTLRVAWPQYYSFPPNMLMASHVLRLLAGAQSGFRKVTFQSNFLFYIQQSSKCGRGSSDIQAGAMAMSDR